MSQPDPLGVMDCTARNTTHYDVGDGWIEILNGEETRRPSSLRRVAYTRVEISFKSEEDFDKFFSIIRDSDKRLSAVPDSDVMYDWQKVRRNGLTVRFGVAWYNNDFYAQKKDAYLSTDHQKMFKAFGVCPDSVRVEHIPI